MPFINWNGKIIPQNQFHISPNNRSFRYGDGCFETIKVINLNIILQDLHFQRIISSLNILFIPIPNFFTIEYFAQQILLLVSANKHLNLARVRMTFYRNGDGLHLSESENSLHFIIQSWQEENAPNVLNKKGLLVDIYPNAKKTCDVFSNIKSNNYLPYIMGKIWANTKQLDDCLITNTNDGIADATIANVFIIADGIVKTPSLDQGCVNGTMRKHLLTCFEKEQIPYEETELKEEDLLNASEMFFTNAMYGIKWVGSFKNKEFDNQITSKFHLTFIESLFFQ